MTSIAHIAQAAKVAPSTVSRVINRPETVGRATRQKVQNILDQADYTLRGRGRPSQRAVSLHVAVFYTPRAKWDGHLSGVVRGWLQGLRDGLERPSVHVSILSAGELSPQDPMFLEVVEAGKLDGAVLIGATPEDDCFQRVLERGVPVVAMNIRPEHAEFSSVTVDYFDGGRQAAEHLMDLGHRRLAICHGHGWRVEEMAAGFQRAIARRGLAAPLVLTNDLPQAQLNWDRIARQLLDANVTALFTMDRRALELTRALSQLNVEVPSHLSVMGFGNQGVRTAGGLNLTSIGFDKRGMGRTAGELLLRMIRSANQVRSSTVVLATRLVEGDTTAAPPQNTET